MGHRKFHNIFFYFIYTFSKCSYFNRMTRPSPKSFEIPSLTQCYCLLVDLTTKTQTSEAQKLIDFNCLLQISLRFAIVLFDTISKDINHPIYKQLWNNKNHKKLSYCWGIYNSCVWDTSSILWTWVHSHFYLTCKNHFKCIFLFLPSFNEWAIYHFAKYSFCSYIL